MSFTEIRCRTSKYISQFLKEHSHNKRTLGRFHNGHPNFSVTKNVDVKRFLPPVGSYETPYPDIVIDNSPRKLHQEKHKRFISARAAAITSLLLSVLCFLLVFTCACIFFHNVNSGSVEDANDSEEATVCVPCIQLNPDPLKNSPASPLNTLDRLHIPENDTDICCARTPAQYAILFKLILQRQEGVKKLSDILGTGNSGRDDSTPFRPRNGTSVSAHLLIKPVPMVAQTDSSSDQSLQQWKSPAESSISHVREGLRFHDNQIFVSTPGLYFVYCQILYMHAGDGDTSEPQVASNYVKRTSVLYPGTSGILLKSRHTRYNQERDRHSSYVGGLFFLHEGDALYVQVSEPGLISHDDTASFFGLFRVGE